MSVNLVQKTAEYVKLKLENEVTGHDWYHVERVYKTAILLQEKEGGNLKLIELAALLHDLGDYKQYDLNEIKGSFVLRGMMDILGLSEKTKEKILKIIEEAQYNADETKVPSTIEGKIIQDADWLDVLGAIGIARVFATGGKLNRVIYDPNKKVRKKLTKAEYQHRKSEGTSFNYFYEKILKLPAMMNTKTAKEIATGRIEYVKGFMEEFLVECEGKK
jgi:uncharacterized protein